MSGVNDLCWEIRFAKIPVMNLCDFLSGIAGGFNKAAINGTECILQNLLAGSLSAGKGIKVSRISIRTAGASSTKKGTDLNGAYLTAN